MNKPFLYGQKQWKQMFNINVPNLKKQSRLVLITCGMNRPGRQHRCDLGFQMHRCKHTPKDIVRYRVLLIPRKKVMQTWAEQF